MSNIGTIQVLCITDEKFGVNTYCIVCGNKSIIIDPLLTSSFLDFMKQFDVDYIILTHEHYDHVCSINDIRKRFGIKVFCGEKAFERLSDPSSNMSRYIEFMLEAIPFGNHLVEPNEYVCSADSTLGDQQTIEWQGHLLFIKETPGHSKGSISILLDNQYLFSGDTIFKDYPTATRMPGGNTKAFKSITEPWLDSLPQDTMVYPGHGKAFLLKERYQK